MPAVSRVLVVGAGAAGAATAVFLAQNGVHVDVIDVKTEATALGSGITLQGNALRVFQQLGVLDQVIEAGYPYDGLGLRAPDADGTLLAEIPDAKTGGPDLPAVVGMLRPDMARILIERAESVGATVRYGTTCATFTQDEHGVDVSFSDGSTGRYDLVVGADGIRSWTRRTLGIELETRDTGMGIWRVYGPRPESITRTDLFYGGPAYIAGYCPTGENSMYAYLVEPATDRSGLAPEQQLEVIRELASHYHGPWDEIRVSLNDASKVNYTWFETHVLDAPWHRGRVVLIGDAAHACPPTLAQGAAMALEDAAVLAELLTSSQLLDEGLWQTFTERRYARAKWVVDASNQLGQWLLDGVQGDVPALMHQLAELVSEPA
ncbi:FAD-dependent monooxygenase [Streptomyces sp. NPDC047841]|uniref:FAD-dependent monooxygenase n=1 Tax=Streptomyces sp. NPDC047841 TaxID=3154708 RepID=UPI003452B4C8